MRTTRDFRGTLALALVTTLCAPVGVVALPGAAVARTVEVAPVTNVRADASIDKVNLTWEASTEPDLFGSVVRGRPGTVPPNGPADGFPVDADVFATSASISDLESGVPYSFAVFARDLTGEFSAPATVTVSSLLVSAALSAKRAVLGQAVTLSGRVTDAVTGAPVPYTGVTIFGAPRRTGELVPITEAFTRGDGRYTLLVTPPEHAEFVVVATGDAAHLAGVAVSPLISISSAVHLRSLTRKGPLGNAFALIGGADPITTGVPLVLQERVKKRWKTVLQKKPSRNGVARFKVTPKTRGKHVYRVKRGAVPGVAGGTSRTVTITVS